MHARTSACHSASPVLRAGGSGCVVLSAFNWCCPSIPTTHVVLRRVRGQEAKSESPFARTSVCFRCQQNSFTHRGAPLKKRPTRFKRAQVIVVGLSASRSTSFTAYFTSVLSFAQ